MCEEFFPDLRGVRWPANAVSNYREARFVVSSPGRLPFGFDELHHAKLYAIELLPEEFTIRDTLLDISIFDERSRRSTDSAADQDQENP